MQVIVLKLIWVCSSSINYNTDSSIIYHLGGSINNTITNNSINNTNDDVINDTILLILIMPVVLFNFCGHYRSYWSRILIIE